MNLEQVRALAAIVDTGSFELAARALHLTPSAVSQRVRALESSVGQVVVRRVHPCTATEAGAVLVRLARQVELLEEDSRDLLGIAREAPVVLRIAVNADSLDTWLVDLLDAAASWDDSRLRFSIVHEDRTLTLLRQGECAAAVSTVSQPVPGCRSHPLGVMRYLPVAAPGLAARFSGTDGELDWDAMPVLRYDDHDHVQEQFLAARGRATSSPASQVPSSPGLKSALLAGMGWLLVPEATVAEELTDGRIVTLSDEFVDVVLHWHVWKVPSHRLERLNDAVLQAARTGLRPLPKRPRGARSGQRVRSSGRERDGEPRLVD
ncbi:MULTISPECIES: ArgP/LysG family DNA-binding transcriptional regulator [unclassified Knoellia]|uniref:ArgP/LysG family DNA-binding transcriptional regulator n=1 Tax=Knoellia altitudinis TaxID=3404795 RepID=UPI00362104CE